MGGDPCGHRNLRAAAHLCRVHRLDLLRTRCGECLRLSQTRARCRAPLPSAGISSDAARLHCCCDRTGCEYRDQPATPRCYWTRNRISGCTRIRNLATTGETSGGNLMLRADIRRGSELVEQQITIRAFEQLEEMRVCEQLQRLVWKYSEIEVVPH